MFGFASFSQVPFSSLPRVGIPAQATLDPQILNAFVTSPTVSGKSSYVLESQPLLNIFAEDLRIDTRYFITGISMESLVSSVIAKADATGTVLGEGLNLSQADLRTIIGYRITGIGLISAIQSLNVSGKSNTNVTGSEMTSFLNDVIGKANARGFAASQLLNIYEGDINATGTATVRLDSLPAVITVDNVLVWGVVPDNQDPDWVVVDDSQTEVWAAVDSDQSTTWTTFTITPTGWVVVDDSEDEDWTEVIH